MNAPKARPGIRFKRTFVVIVALATVLITIGAVQPSASAADRSNLGLYPVVVNDPPGVPGSYTCLAAVTPGNGQPVDAKFCGDNRVTQQWRVIKVQNASGNRYLQVRFKNIGNGRCIDADTSTLYPYLDGGRSDFTVQMWACNDSVQQTWDVTFGPGSVWSFPDGINRETRFLVKDPSGRNLPVSVARHFRLDSRASDNTSKALLVKVGTGDFEQRILGGDFHEFVPFPETIKVDSPGLQCAMAGYSGEVVRTSSADPPTFRCQ